jgi:pimeloyl-ACP methyl ester carboxylesterase
MAVAVDTPGAGMSDPASSEPDIGMLSFAIDAVLLHLRAENVYLVGHHTGGNLAASFAARRPGNVRGLVISGPEAGFVYRHYESSLPEAPRADGAHLTNLWALMVAYAPEGLSPALLTRHFSYAVLCRDHAWHQNFATAKFNAGTCYEAVKSPTLVLCGTRDPMYAYVEETRRLRPDFEFVEFPGATSYILDQDCAGWCAAILAFLSRAA